MKNAKCKITVCPPGMISFVCEADTIILHFEFCILHFMELLLCLFKQ